MKVTTALSLPSGLCTFQVSGDKIEMAQYYVFSKTSGPYNVYVHGYMCTCMCLCLYNLAENTVSAVCSH